MEKTLQRIVAIACIVILAFSVIPTNGVYAAYNNKPGTPSITVENVNGTDVKVTIGKTSGADGYEVWITSDCGYMGYKNENHYFGKYNYNDNSGNFINAATIEKDGTAVRTVTIKNLSTHIGDRHSEGYCKGFTVAAKSVTVYSTSQ